MTQANNDLDSLLDATLDDLADIPEFKPFPAGAHKLTINFERKTDAVVPTIIVKLTYIEPVELAENQIEGITEAKQGDTTNLLLQFKNKDGSKNEFAEGTFKMIIAGLKESFPGSTNGEIMEAAQGAEILAVTSVRANKKDPHDIKYNTNLVALSVV